VLFLRQKFIDFKHKQNELTSMEIQLSSGAAETLSLRDERQRRKAQLQVGNDWLKAKINGTSHCQQQRQQHLSI